jgi:hypothetical protein
MRFLAVLAALVTLAAGLAAPAKACPPQAGFAYGYSYAVQAAPVVYQRVYTVQTIPVTVGATVVQEVPAAPPIPAPAPAPAPTPCTCTQQALAQTYVPAQATATYTAMAYAAPTYSYATPAVGFAVPLLYGRSYGAGYGHSFQRAFVGHEVGFVGRFREVGVGFVGGAAAQSGGRFAQAVGGGANVALSTRGGAQVAASGQERASIRRGILPGRFVVRAR